MLDKGMVQEQYPAREPSSLHKSVCFDSNNNQLIVEAANQENSIPQIKVRTVFI